MRLFQNLGVYPSYRPRLTRLTRGSRTFREAVDAMLDDRFAAAHVLEPVLRHAEDAFFAIGDFAPSQRLWAREQGLPSAALETILLAQIEHHRTEVFYNMDPMRYGDDFLARLPGCVRRTIGWRAAPSAGGRFLGHDVIVNNFPSILEDYRAQGARVAYFFPAHDPAMDAYAARTERDIDVLFVGTYSRYHRQRATMLETIAGLGGGYKVAMHLDRSRLTRLAETPLGWWGPLRRHRRAKEIRAVALPPVFGRDLLDALGRARVVVNGAIDMALRDRGNMRVWEAMGCRTALLSDAGRYPEHMDAGRQFESYGSTGDMVAKLSTLLRDEAHRSSVADAGYAAVSTCYSKARQWDAFVDLAS